jgi:hypothetical protein
MWSGACPQCPETENFPLFPHYMRAEERDRPQCRSREVLMELAVAAVITGILIAVLRTPVRYQDSPSSPADPSADEAPGQDADPCSEPTRPQV